MSDQPITFTIKLMDLIWLCSLSAVIGYAYAYRFEIAEWVRREMEFRRFERGLYEAVSDPAPLMLLPDEEPHIDQPYDWADHE